VVAQIRGQVGATGIEDAIPEGKIATRGQRSGSAPRSEE
jgi:hypothetical protein